jgi:hypothetical protein
VSARDTTPDAMATRTAIYRAMSDDRRAELAVETSLAMRAIALENIRARHPDYTEYQARMALFRLLVGDELFRKVWPQAPLLAP